MNAFSLKAIEYTPNQNTGKAEPTSYADRMMKESMEAPAHEAFNSMKNGYSWDREATSKRPIR